MFDTERFISEIEKRPAIYNTNCDEYNDRTAKLAAWDEVCQVMIRNWPTLSDEERIVEEKNLRGKWRNIRDYFMKELKVQNLKNLAGSAGRKRKRYTYFDQLQFLMPSIENKQRYSYQVPQLSNKRENNYVNHCKTEESEGEADNPVFDDYEISGNEAGTSKDYVQAVNSSGNYRMLPTVRYSKPMCETSIAPFDNEFQDMISNNGQRSMIEEEDYDKMFLLSLLPILRQIPENKKLDVRIQMQQILAAVLYPSDSK
ncbi:uncharacterized protein LOC122498212 isoform X1 [Leptopilina heterotoma]|uniref:uncharacterized protein LOC122498212 isoform X1 n=1 Tax=Leptopilina heterotoma TaxID=63436 RepID=UPI001CA88CAD|nr:uncharacterized protein LOC122498212 isoform X1 [Leptopilina heterotoma]